MVLNRPRNQVPARLEKGLCSKRALWLFALPALPALH
jgi:hypothetical protein